MANGMLTEACSPGSSTQNNETVREFLDRQIEHSRKKTLYLCTAKAKAELVGVLDMPANELRSFTDYY